MQTEPATALLEIDGVAAGSSPLVREFPRDGRQHSLRVGAPGYESLMVSFRDEPPPSIVRLTASIPAAPVPVIAPVVRTTPTRSPERQHSAAATRARTTANDSPILR